MARSMLFSLELRIMKILYVFRIIANSLIGGTFALGN